MSEYGSLHSLDTVKAKYPNLRETGFRMAGKGKGMSKPKGGGGKAPKGTKAPKGVPMKGGRYC